LPNIFILLYAACAANNFESGIERNHPLYPEWEKNKMQSSARVNAALKSSLIKARQYMHAQKFAFETVTHTNSVSEIRNLLKTMNDCSDHLPVMHRDALTATWNMLKQCSVEENEVGIVIKTNNGFNRGESPAEYQARLISNLGDIGKLASAQTSDLANIPVTVLCLQEITSDALKPIDIDQQLRASGFTIYRNPEQVEAHLIQECTEKKDEILVTAYDYNKVACLESYSIPASILSTTQANEARFQATKFMDKATQQVFVVVNAHQNWDAVNVTHANESEPSSNHDVMHILDYFQKLGLPCIITGDFNTTNIPLPTENGKIVIGKNANMCWNFKTAGYQLDSCDHIVMNEKYYREFLPNMRQNLLIQQETKLDTPKVIDQQPNHPTPAGSPEKAPETCHFSRL
jgi:hypothetical protein